MENIRVNIHSNICRQLNETYKAKNADYGNSFAKIRQEYHNAVLIRLMDKLERLKMLYDKEYTSKVNESIDDTLIDLANYAIMEVIERRIDGNRYVKELIEDEA